MTLFEYCAKVASLLSRRDKTEYAFLLSTAGNVVCVGAHTGEAKDTYETSLINALQNNTRHVGSNTWAMCTYNPTQMCQGMAHLLSMQGIRYTVGGDDRVVKMKKDSWDEGTFRSNVQGFGVSCNAPQAVEVKWNGVVEEALKQAKDSKNFNTRAVALLQAMDNGTKTPNTTRAKESDKIASALNVIPANPPPGEGFDKADEVYTHLLFGMVGQTWNPTLQAVKGSPALTPGEQAMGNNIAGILLDHTFKIVGWALNFAGENPTFHAETLMVQRFLRVNGLKKLPPNYTVYTSLQPCDMCGSFLMHVGDKTKVVYCLKDVNLSTVLTQTKSPNAASERQVTITGTGKVAKAIEIGAALANKNKTAQTNSAVLLSDAEDKTYRTLSLQAKGKTPKQVGLGDGTVLMQSSPFTYAKPLPGTLGTLETSGGQGKKNRLGFEFVKSADLILAWAKDNKIDPKVKKAAAQGVEIFEALVTGGFVTAYGLKMINIVFEKQRKAEEEAAKTLAATSTQ